MSASSSDSRSAISCWDCSFAVVNSITRNSRCRWVRLSSEISRSSSSLDEDNCVIRSLSNSSVCFRLASSCWFCSSIAANSSSRSLTRCSIRSCCCSNSLFARSSCRSRSRFCSLAADSSASFSRRSSSARRRSAISRSSCLLTAANSSASSFIRRSSASRYSWSSFRPPSCSDTSPSSRSQAPVNSLIRCSNNSSASFRLASSCWFFLSIAANSPSRPFMHRSSRSRCCSNSLRARLSFRFRSRSRSLATANCTACCSRRSTLASRLLISLFNCSLVAVDSLIRFACRSSTCLCSAASRWARSVTPVSSAIRRLKRSIACSSGAVASSSCLLTSLKQRLDCSSSAISGPTCSFPNPDSPICCPASCSSRLERF